MIKRTLFFILLCSAGLLLIACSPQPAAPAPPAAPAQQIHGNLVQLMRGMLFPPSNVLFAAQGQDPKDYKLAEDPSTTPDPLASTYGGWQAVENAGITLSEAANLLTIPGRKCANGKDVPIQNPDWAKFVQGLRDAGDLAYKAGQSKNQDMVLDAAEKMTTACANCHEKYREKPDLKDRC